MEILYGNCLGLAITVALLLLIKNYAMYKKNTHTKTPFADLLLLIPLTLMLPVIFLLFALLWIYRQIVSFILVLRHGSKFGGLLPGNDAMFCLDGSKNPAHILLVIRCKLNNSQNFYEFVKDHARKNYSPKLDKFLPLFGTIENRFGYFYLLKNEVALDDCFKGIEPLNTPTNDVTEADMLKLMHEYSKNPLPKNGKALWEVLVGTQPIQWNNGSQDGETKLYPIIVRFHHVLADGWSFFNFLRSLADSDNVETQECSVKRKPRTYSTCYSSVFKKLKFSIHCLYMACLTPSIIVQRLKKENDLNVLHGPPLSKRTLFSLNVEESPRCVEIIKGIQMAIPGSSFTEILLTAVGASFSEYFEKNPSRIPPFITALVTHKQRSADSNSGKKLRVSVHNQRIPISVDDANFPLISRLQSLMKEENSNEIEANHWIFNFVATLLPRPALESLFGRLIYATCIVTNLQGAPCMTFFGGCPLQDTIYWTAHLERTGLSLVFSTYNGRLQMGLHADRRLIYTQEKLDCILNNVAKYVHMLDDEAKRWQSKQSTGVKI